jgi:hypothetical protein
MSALGQKQTCAAHKPVSAMCQERTLFIEGIEQSAAFIRSGGGGVAS